MHSVVAPCFSQILPPLSLHFLAILPQLSAFFASLFGGCHALSSLSPYSSDCSTENSQWSRPEEMAHPGLAQPSPVWTHFVLITCSVIFRRQGKHVAGFWFHMCKCKVLQSRGLLGNVVVLMTELRELNPPQINQIFSRGISAFKELLIIGISSALNVFGSC